MKEIVYKILWSTIEDFVGLWEVLWELNSIFPEKSHDKNKKNAKKILRYFLEQNLVVLYLNKWGSDQLEEMSLNESIKILEDDKYWRPPLINELCIKVGNTEKGEKFYYEDLVIDFM
ncbi:MAG: hypothetical protein H6574_20740 [Lewinellaceae bacterium]|nr:hypothetical protein [Lewinellaceae bacterium]